MIPTYILSGTVFQILRRIHQIIAFERGFLSLTNSFLETSAIIAISHVLVKTKFFELHYRFIFNHFSVIED